jgi:hypothetical protein
MLVASVGHADRPSGSFSYANRTVCLPNGHLLGLAAQGQDATPYGSG